MHFLVVILMFACGLVHCREVWLDPHDMNVGLKSQTQETNVGLDVRDGSTGLSSKLDDHDDTGLSSKLQSTEPNGYCEKEVCKCPNAADSSYIVSHYRRTINRILSSVVYDRASGNHYKGFIDLNIRQDDFDFLNAFVKGLDESPEAFRVVDKILDRILSIPSHKFFTEALITWTDHLYFTFYNRTTGILVACLFVVFVSYKLLRASFTLWTVIKYIVFVAWVVDGAFTWNRLLQEHELNQMADTTKYDSMPAHCRPSQEMSWWTFIFSSWGSEDECRKYHRAMFENVFWKVGPTEILGHQMGVIVLTPASYIGKAVGSMAGGILGSLPFGLNLVLLPILLIFFLILTCLVLSFVTNTSFKINLFHLLSLDFGNEERRRIGDVISGDNLRKMLDIIQRNAIEDITETGNINTNTSIESAISSAPAVAINQPDEKQSVENKEENITSGDASCSKKSALNSAIETIGDSSSQRTGLENVQNDLIHNDGAGDTT